MNILLGNDDGIESEGIKELAAVLAKRHNVLIADADGNKSRNRQYNHLQKL